MCFRNICYITVRMFSTRLTSKKAVAFGLVYFDFDGTLVDGLDKLTEEVPLRMIPDPDFDFGPPEKSHQGPNEQKVCKTLKSATLIDGMKDVIETLRKQGSKLIVVSDNFDYVIERFLDHNDVRQHFSNIFSHHARFAADDVLEIKPNRLHYICDQKQWRLKKDVIVNTFQNGSKPSKVMFVCDGVNDLRVIEVLKESDVAFVRKSFELDLFLKASQATTKQIKPNVAAWTNGFDILSIIRYIGF